jgi:molybdopterin-containing oxidoreductase family iron-sulfur binding subunit
LFEAVEHQPTDQRASLRELVADMQAGKVDRSLILDSNPVYDAPGFAARLKRVPLSIALTSTSERNQQRNNMDRAMTHEWETWSDARAYNVAHSMSASG